MVETRRSHFISFFSESTRPYGLVVEYGNKNNLYHLYSQYTFQRAHFSIFVPSATNPDWGTKIHAVDAPMAGYVLEFKRHYNLSLNPHDQTFPIGRIHSSDIVDSPDAAPSMDSTRGEIKLAAQVSTPGITTSWHLSMMYCNIWIKLIYSNFQTTNKRCQEWTMEYVRHLVAKGLIDEEAI
ncbi:hypothetical protein N7449_001906 [Penicillium cf. viridicatum]|uniref:Uncharacterized protein n=1 Tax=Penicillium cf. viridicatum TaxID=2972119 RepID=A0A9W9N7M2_9EURO|nr:hypothetical protein N7449_001906 [Penicillium cf. viridicatum]